MTTLDLAPTYTAVRQTTLDLAAPLSSEDCQVQSMPDASPTKWHLAHVTWFFETFVLERFEPAFQAFDASFRVLFNSYYQGVGAMHPRAQRGLVTRPTLATVKNYRAAVDARMQRLLNAQPDNAALAQQVILGLHHEQQHQELLLTDIKHALSFNPSHAPYVAADSSNHSAETPAPLHWLRFEGGLIHHGFDAELDGSFCFDNETPRHRTYTAPFELGHRLVTDGEYLAFMQDGGYQRPELWLSMGWEWVQQQTANATSSLAPLYWREQGGQWWQHTLCGLAPLNHHNPATHLNYFEADAYARWAGARLPTEQEWELAARSLYAAPRPTPSWHPAPAISNQNAALQQMWGHVWQWTQSSYAAYPGYMPLPGAVGEYNGKFMCNQYVLRGSSCATPAGHARTSYRNFFPAHAQWQFSGLRLAR
jgi:ergothioneine biosynthesis protein EgtB